jgi:hypothetical protein
MLGTLQQVTLEIVADLAGSAKAESKNNTPSTITLDLQATLQLLDPNELNTVLVQATPLVHRVFAASARDGAIDFAGTAGVTYSGLATQLSSQASFSDTATLGLFTGTGQLNLPFVALGESLAQGPGNFRAGFTTLAGGRVNVTYSFEPLTQLTGSMQPVPEPTTWALMFAGLAMVLLLANRRRHGD